MAKQRSDPADLTVIAVPFYFAGMAVEYVWLRRTADRRSTSGGDYERRDTIASLTMGFASLVVPLVAPRVVGPITPGRSRFGKALVAAALGAVAATTVADVVVRRSGRGLDGATVPGQVSPGGDEGPPEARLEARLRRAERARRLASVGGVASIALGGVAVAATWASSTAPHRLWRRRILPDLGSGPVALALAIVGWDFIYYWNHRFMHECRYLWAVHVVHHSSEHYNLSTALRQPVADALATTLPYGTLCLLGIAPELITTARGVNLLYQFWIHTETVGRIGRAEAVLNTPSHHRVHHGSNSGYLDRNHGSILIVWDRLFGTFEPEVETVVYGLTQDIGTFDPARIATHEFAALFGDVARSAGWAERLSHVVRGPGWGPGVR